MTRADIYCRVSTENQETEGTSLQTQLEACMKYRQSKGYDVAYCFSETYSGLSLERPELDKLRELVRNEQIDVLVVYCLDRLSRNATHGVILRDELDKYNVKLESVTEDIDKTPLGEAITYLRGTFSQIEAEKIRERTMRGKKARARQGRMSGSFHTTYGYDYIPVSQENGGRRVINETESSWVNQIYQWLVNDGLTTGVIRNRLEALSVPSKKGKHWTKVSIMSILKNPAYTGKTYAFTCSMKRKPRRKPVDEWIEIPGATPAIISQELFDAAQKQLQVNRAKATRNNTTNQYLLRGHTKCRQCGRAYVGGVTNKRADGSHGRLYRCLGKWKERSPIELCHNRYWNADKLEAMVWGKLVEYLSDRDLIINELEKQRNDAGQLGVYEAELERIERQLRALDREQHQLLQWALKGFPESQVISENQRLTKAKETLKVQKTELEAQLKASQDAVINIPKLEGFIRDMQDKLPLLDFEGKRLALEMLGIMIWLDGETVEITGTIDTESVVIVDMPLRQHWLILLL
ncbi:MAG: recombinase family protein [Dehalococcoidia bacterium]|nr:recombinase family protein [Dehalococcoidia bacterium]